MRQWNDRWLPVLVQIYRGPAPTVEETGVLLGGVVKSTANFHLDRMLHAGLILREPGVERGLQLTARGKRRAREALGLSATMPPCPCCRQSWERAPDKEVLQRIEALLEPYRRELRAHRPSRPGEPADPPSWELEESYVNAAGELGWRDGYTGRPFFPHPSAYRTNERLLEYAARWRAGRAARVEEEA